MSGDSNRLGHDIAAAFAEPITAWKVGAGDMEPAQPVHDPHSSFAEILDRGAPAGFWAMLSPREYLQTAPLARRRQ